MGFLQSKAAQKGYKRQGELIPLIEVILLREGYEGVIVKSGTLNEDMVDHIDAKIYCDKIPFKGHFISPIDIKTGESFTLYNTKGENTLENTKSKFLVYEYDEDDNSLMFISVSKLRELVRKYPPKLRESKYNPGSKYFWLSNYVDDHVHEFGIDELFWLQK